MYMYVYVLDANTESQISSVSMPIPIATKPGSIIEKTCECVNVMKRLLSDVSACTMLLFLATG